MRAGFTDNPRLDRVREIAKAEGAVVVPVCAAIEAEISQLEEADRADFLKELKLDEPGLESRDPRRAMRCSGCRPISPRARRKCARGRCARARPRRRPRV